MSERSVAVVGAGLAGLTAAYRLKRQGVRVTLYEAASRAGGVICSERDGGYLADLGANSFSDPLPGMREVLRDLELDDTRIAADPAARRRYVVHHGRLVPLPTSPAAVLRSPLLSFSGKLRLLGEPFVPRGHPRESVAEFVRRRLGSEAATYLADPFVAGVYAGDPERLSARHALQRLYGAVAAHGSLARAAVALAAGRATKRRGPPRQWSFPEGMQTLTDRFVERLRTELRLDEPVTSLAPELDGWRVESRHGGGELTARHRGVVLAVPAHALGRIWFDRVAAPEAVARIAAIPHPPVSVLALGFARGDVGHPLDGFGFLVPSVERRHVLGVLFSSTIFPGRAPAGHAMLTVFVGGTRSPESAGWDVATLTDAVLDELRPLLGIRGAPTFRRHALWSRAIPQPVIEHDEVLGAIEQFERCNPAILFAGTYRRGVAVGDAMAAGLDAGDRATAWLAD